MFQRFHDVICKKKYFSYKLLLNYHREGPQTVVLKYDCLSFFKTTKSDARNLQQFQVEKPNTVHCEMKIGKHECRNILIEKSLKKFWFEIFNKN